MKWRPYKILLIRLSIALFLFTLSRILFAIFNPVTLSGLNLLPFIYGIRYDLSALVFIHSIFILLHIYPTSSFFKKNYQTFLSLIFHIMNGVALLLNSIDTAWFPFTQKRTTADFFKLISTGDDVGNNIGRYLLDYWYVLFIWAGLLFIGVLLYRKTKNNVSSFSLFKVPTRIIIFLVLTFCTLVFGRGGLQYKPLSIQSAVTAAGPASIPLVLNTPFTIIKSFRDDPLPSTVYFTDKKADELFDPHQRLSTTAEFTHQNVRNNSGKFFV